MGQPERGGGGEPNRVVWAVIVGLIVVLAIGGAIARQKSQSTVNRGTRAVIVPTADGTRMVIVPPCATGVPESSTNAAALINTTGTTSITLPQRTGIRVVLIPRCSGGHGGVAGASNLPSGAFVTAPGTQPPQIGTGRSSSSASSTRIAAAQDAEYQLTVPNGSPIKAAVVSPCQRPRLSVPASEILAPSGSSTTAVAPPC